MLEQPTTKTEQPESPVLERKGAHNEAEPVKTIEQEREELSVKLQKGIDETEKEISSAMDDLMKLMAEHFDLDVMEMAKMTESTGEVFDPAFFFNYFSTRFNKKSKEAKKSEEFFKNVFMPNMDRFLELDHSLKILTYGLHLVEYNQQRDRLIDVFSGKSDEFKAVLRMNSKVTESLEYLASKKSAKTVPDFIDKEYSTIKPVYSDYMESRKVVSREMAEALDDYEKAKMGILLYLDDVGNGIDIKAMIKETGSLEMTIEILNSKFTLPRGVDLKKDLPIKEYLRKKRQVEIFYRG
jgi:hypothetical protein